MNKIKQLPFVSICTPTFNRRPFIQTMFELFKNQDYPANKMEWIIVDDGTDKIEDLIKSSNIPQIKYIKVDNKMSLGAKRNYTHTFCRGDIIVYMDDDDYYPPNRVSHAVERLLEETDALIAGSSEIYVFFKQLDKIIQFGPYFDNHATAGTFAFKKELLNLTKYEDNKELCEEQGFLKNFSFKMAKLDPMKTILVFAHMHNTVDKYDVFKKGGDKVKESEKTVKDFIKGKNEGLIRDFFMNQMHVKLKKYELGAIKYKPDAVKQLEEDKKRYDSLFMTVEKSKLEQLVNLINILNNKVNEQQNIINELTNKQVIKGNNKLVNLYFKLLNINNKEKKVIYITETIKLYYKKLIELIELNFSIKDTNDDVDIVIYSVLDKIVLNNKSINICISGESYDPQNITDISILSNKKFNYGYNIYFPHVFASLWERKSLFYQNEKQYFCAYMYSVDVQYRIDLFNFINKYKRVDALGKSCNNTNNETDRNLYNETETYNDSAVKKYSKYKFVLALENKIIDGYITEKLINPLLMDILLKN